MGEATTTVSENIKWERCRFCRGEFEELFSLGDLHINDFPDGEPTRGTCPIDIVRCIECGLVQQRWTAPQELLYSGHYWYESGINQTIINDLKEIAKIAGFYLGPGETIIDVGANDGTLLSYIDPRVKRIGVEPATNLTEKLEQHAHAVTEFWENTSFENAKVITAIGMMYDTDDPRKFLYKVKESLAENGVFIAQLMTAKQMVENNDLGNLCHEHIEFYTYENLKTLYEAVGLEIRKVEENGINGGSYRLIAGHYTKGSVDHPEEPLDWKQFAENIKRNRDNVNDFIEKNPGNYYIYGASTKGNLIAEYYGLQVEGAGDANTSKWGKKMVTGTPIVSEVEARANADYFIIMPYGFTEMFLEREREWLARGGTFLVPLPKFYVIEGQLQVGS